MTAAFKGPGVVSSPGTAKALDATSDGVTITAPEIAEQQSEGLPAAPTAAKAG